MGSEGFPLLPISNLMGKGVAMGKLSKRKKEYRRIRADSGQHRRIMVLMALFTLVAVVPTVIQMYRLMVADHE